MKRLLIILVCAVIGSTALFAQDQDRLILVDGDVLQIRDLNQIRLQDKLTLSDGTTVNPDGTYQKKGNARLRLRNGECLDMSGVKYSNEHRYRSKIKQENKNLNQSQMMERNQSRSYLTVIEGNIYQIRNQKQNKLKRKFNLSNGIVVNPDGTYQTKNNKQKHLKEGQCLNMDGELFKTTYQQRKRNIQKNSNINKKRNKNLQKTPIQKINKDQKRGL